MILVILPSLNALASIRTIVLGIVTDVALGTVLLLAIAVTLKVYWLLGSATVAGMFTVVLVDDTNATL